MSMTLRAIVRREAANRAAQAAKVVKPVKVKKAKKEQPVAQVEAVEDGVEAEAPVQAEGEEVAE